MKNIILIILTTFLVSSCTKYVKIIQKNGVFNIKELSTPISNVQEDQWSVGQDREFSISKGIKFDITIPQFEEKSKKALMQVYNIDSWVFKISKIQRGSDITLGYFRYKLSGSAKVSKEVSVHIYYQAAALSQKQRRQKCPELNHNLKVKDFELKDVSTPVNVFVSPKDKIFRDIQEISFSPLIFAGGINLKGVYKVEASLLNSATKKTFMNWTPTNSLVIVSEEDEVLIKTCL